MTPVDKIKFLGHFFFFIQVEKLTKTKNKKQKTIISLRVFISLESLEYDEHLHSNSIDCNRQVDNQLIDNLLATQLLDKLDGMYEEMDDVFLLEQESFEFEQVFHDQQRLLAPFQSIDKRQKRN